MISTLSFSEQNLLRMTRNFWLLPLIILLEASTNFLHGIAVVFVYVIYFIRWVFRDSFSLVMVVILFLIGD